MCVRVLATYPSWSIRSHITLGVGISGEPSYKTTEAPTAKADTSQFHIIQPVYGWTHTHTGPFICHKQPFVTNKNKWEAKWKNSGSYASVCEVFLFLIFCLKKNALTISIKQFINYSTDGKLMNCFDICRGQAVWHFLKEQLCWTEGKIKTCEANLKLTYFNVFCRISWFDTTKHILLWLRHDQTQWYGKPFYVKAPQINNIRMINHKPGKIDIFHSSHLNYIFNQHKMLFLYGLPSEGAVIFED